MKKLILVVAAAIVSVSAFAQAGKVAAGVYGAYETKDPALFGIGAKVQYGVTDQIRPEASFTYFLKKDGLKVVVGQVLGAGGAARAILWGLCKERAKFIAIGARNPQKAQALANDFFNYGRIEGFDWKTDEFKEMLRTADILINTTPLGMFPNVDDMPPVDLKLLPKGALVYDIVYNPEETKLLKTARELGLPTLNGMSMLLLQGKESYRLFTGQLPDMEVMERTIRKHLGAK